MRSIANRIESASGKEKKKKKRGTGLVIETPVCTYFLDNGFNFLSRLKIATLLSRHFDRIKRI
jgi:hypothetical protein